MPSVSTIGSAWATVADDLVARIVPVDPVLLDGHDLEAEVARDAGHGARVVRLDAADRDERVAALRQRVGGEELELARLVAAVREPGVAVVTLRPHVHLAAEVLTQPGEPMHRRRPEEQRRAGMVVEAHVPDGIDRVIGERDWSGAGSGGDSAAWSWS